MKPMDLRDKTILVTGGAGFIGSHVAKKLIGLGAKVIIVDNLNGYYDPELKNARLTTLLKNLPFKLYKIDIAEPEGIKKVFSENKIDLVCHEAAQAGVRYSLENPDAYIQSNIVGTHNIFKLAKKYGIEGIVCGAVASEYQRFRVEAICADLGLRTICPLWHLDPERYMSEFLKDGFTVIFGQAFGV